MPIVNVTLLSGMVWMKPASWKKRVRVTSANGLVSDGELGSVLVGSARPDS